LVPNDDGKRELFRFLLAYREMDVLLVDIFEGSTEHRLAITCQIGVKSLEEKS